MRQTISLQRYIHYVFYIGMGVGAFLGLCAGLVIGVLVL